MRFTELEYNVIKWANKKDLIKEENVYQQYAKFQEESNEILIAINKVKAVIKKAGEIDVTNPNDVGMLNNLRTGANNELKDGIGDTIVTLIILAAQNNLKIKDCLEYAYNEIKNRTGKTIGGTFIKD